MQRKAQRPFVALAAAAALLGGCSPAQWVPSNASVLDDSARAAARSPITVKPAKLAFTSGKVIKLSISEPGYSGAFSVAVGNAKVAAFKGSAKGPSSKIKVIAKGAGATVLTIGDANGHKTKVPVSVTTAVVVIQ